MFAPSLLNCNPLLLLLVVQVFLSTLTHCFSCLGQFQTITMNFFKKKPTPKEAAREAKREVRKEVRVRYWNLLQYDVECCRSTSVWWIVYAHAAATIFGLLPSVLTLCLFVFVSFFLPLFSFISYIWLYWYFIFVHNDRRNWITSIFLQLARKSRLYSFEKIKKTTLRI